MRGWIGLIVAAWVGCGAMPPALGQAEEELSPPWIGAVAFVVVPGQVQDLQDWAYGQQWDDVSVNLLIQGVTAETGRRWGPTLAICLSRTAVRPTPPELSDRDPALEALRAGMRLKIRGLSRLEAGRDRYEVRWSMEAPAREGRVVLERVDGEAVGLDLGPWPADADGPRRVVVLLKQGV